MSKERLDDLMKKFEAGESTLSEDSVLFDRVNKSDSAFGLWANFCNEKKLKPTVDFKDSVWEAIHSREARKRKIRTRVMMAAVFVVLLVSLSIVKINKINYEKKKALLKEALTMLEKNTPAQNNINIIFEDDMVIIYTEDE